MNAAFSLNLLALYSHFRLKDILDILGDIVFDIGHYIKMVDNKA